MRRSLLLLLASCTQVFGLEAPARTEPPLPDALELDDASADAETRTCIDKWLEGPTFTAPQLVTAVNTTADEWDPNITRDGLELYFTRATDIHVVTRTSVTAPWGPVSASQFNSPQGETKVTIANDRLRAYVASNRPGAGGVDLWRYRRTLVTDPWIAEQALLENVNTAGDEHDPHLSLDSLRIYLAVSVDTQTLAVATRDDTTSSYRAPVVLAPLNVAGQEADPSLTDDERVIVYAVTSGNPAPRRLMYATRASMTASFSAGIELTQLNELIGFGESDANISPDGCTLYFRSTRGGNGDIYVTTIE